ncbi:COG1361 family protein [Caproiciproducens faecalis]|uniref:Cell adhesion protein n=1 Tax=Caproiciproducens faecalis TaxID=2820301 RepID=A0ABS7DSY9_9FIRM|nr:cell adhesion protein [Caproiciproducens faecalis]MBW7573935.1 cell adhesion protein [Caproiciproducens faecalis]
MKRTGKRRVSLILSVLLITAFCFGSLPASAATYAQPSPTVNSEKLTVSKGSPFQAIFYFYHPTEYSNKDSITITVESSNDAISLKKKTFKYDKNSTEQNDEIDPDVDEDYEGNDASYSLTIPELYMKRIGDGAGTLKFTIYYNNDKSETYVAQKTIFDPTGTGSDTEDDGKLVVQSYQLDHTPVKEGEKFNLTFTLKNTGSVVCDNIMAVLDTSTADGISINGVTDTQYINTLDTGTTTTISYPMTCLSKMTTNNYTVSLILSADEIEKSVTSKVFIPVTGTKTDKDETTNASKPLIIIENYDYGGKAVMGGKEFNLAMNFKNTSTNTQIENLKITVSSVAGDDDKSVAGAFTPAKSSNTFYIPKVAPNSVFAEQIALIPKADATPNSYGVSIAFNYEAVLDGKREAIDATETIAIPLTQSDRFEANEADLQGPISLGDSGQLNINYVNKGKSKIFNLSVKLEGNFTTGESNTYIGNVDSGVGDTFQASLNPTEEGTMTGTATFSYEDANGEIKNLVKDFSCEVMPAMQPGEGIDSEPSVPANAGVSSPPVWMILAGIGGLAVVIAVLVILHKKRKAKKLKLLEQSDDYDDLPTEANHPAKEEKS